MMNICKHKLESQNWTKTHQVKDSGKNQGSPGLDLVGFSWELWAPTQSFKKKIGFLT